MPTLFEKYLPVWSTGTVRGFEYVATDVDWTVMGIHPLAGHYRSKADFLEETFTKLVKAFRGGAELHVEYRSLLARQLSNSAPRPRHSV
jgi:ketosteroid isomerase-like protein